MKSFFISYNKADRDWAVWIAWQLEQARYTTIIQDWDFRPGCDFVSEMHAATMQSERTIAILSPGYLTSLYAESEWAAAYRSDPTGTQRRLIPIRVRECAPGGLLGSRVFIDLVGLSQEQAIREILDGVTTGRPRPAVEPAFPVDQGQGMGERPRFPGPLKLPDPRPESWLPILHEVLTLPRVRDAVVACKIDCQAMCQQLDNLMTYKELHDQLHHLQFHCYDPTMRAIATGTVDVGSFSEYELTLQEIVTELWKIDSRLKPDMSGANWIQRLDAAHREMYSAIEAADVARIQRVMNTVRRVLDRQPSRINDWIVESARELRLTSVVQKLAEVCGGLTEAEIDLDKVRDLKQGLADLSRLTENLASTRDDHAAWQQIDVELRNIDAWITSSADELLESWPAVRTFIDPLCGGSRETWAVRFKDTSARLDRAITLREKEAAGLYMTFRSQAGRRFFHVDTDMKRVCEQLRLTGGPLVVALGGLS